MRLPARPQRTRARARKHTRTHTNAQTFKHPNTKAIRAGRLRRESREDPPAPPRRRAPARPRVAGADILPARASASLSAIPTLAAPALTRMLRPAPGPASSESGHLGRVPTVFKRYAALERPRAPRRVVACPRRAGLYFVPTLLRARAAVFAMQSLPPAGPLSSI